VGRLLAHEGGTRRGVALVDALARAAAGRHLVLWSAAADEQAALNRAALDGDVSAEGGDLVSATLQNLGGGQGEGNKLDYYARRQVTVRATVGRREAHVEQEITLRNGTPAKPLPAYVAGLDEPGTVNGLVTLALPRGASLSSFTRDGRASATDLLPEADHRVLTSTITLGPGAETTWNLRYILPVTDGRYVLHVVPQPLAVDAGLRVELRAASGLRLQGPASGSGALAGRRVFAVQAAAPGVRDAVLGRLARFWREPVRLP
ncbi:MAG: rane protein, partial [Frankiales bacterium]|nr:rane protein [Frankiales bacterium]